MTDVFFWLGEHSRDICFWTAIAAVSWLMFLFLRDLRRSH